MESAMASQRTALVTGGNKGIGFEIARQLGEAGVRVFIGSRDEQRGQEAAQKLSSAGLDVQMLRLDVNERRTIDEAAAAITRDEGSLSILINNAGIASWHDGPPSSASVRVVEEILETNFLGALAVTQAMLPLLLRSPESRIVNVSSALGSLTVNGDRSSPFYSARSIGYNASKAALNMLTVQLDAEFRDSGLTAVSVSPGFVKTDLLGGIGTISAADGAAVVVGVALEVTAAGAGRHVSADGDIPW
jgi:NAD(P)-dependent dehydrogenase (short-subunit alcohol dehydrogenase family)